MKRPLLTAFLFGCCCILVTSDAGAAGCKITEPCCSSQPIQCTTDQTCSCYFQCGPGVASCTCKCVTSGGGGGESNKLPRKPIPPTQTFGVSIGGDLSLGAFAGFLEQRTGWRIEAEGDVVELRHGPASWGGHIGEVMTAIADSFGVRVEVDEEAHRIRFLKH